ncbi:hypothetical protein COLO4_00175 [Corchorus olitorius]|uniref:Uncharacterized protein n=1 Tax=Corchorus olitorius TaxID=93759 RepID=A0A1R3L4K2_9ROSI|nr:hypothetical protein COLO4_00175 [Corchorus olitorius]
MALDDLCAGGNIAIRGGHRSMLTDRHATEPTNVDLVFR